tara:strand:- start:1553 stop:1795 length:243 start_codon:yes stop_codon:yes gene_type:complete
MRLLKIWLRLLNTSIMIAYYRIRLFNQRILFQLDEWFVDKEEPVSSKIISADTPELIEEVEEDKLETKYKAYDGPVCETP